MATEVPQPNDELTPKELGCYRSMSQSQRDEIDETIFTHVADHWKKVAWVAVQTHEVLESRFPEFSINFYAERIGYLADRGRLNSKGNVAYMRFSEVRSTREG